MFEQSILHPPQSGKRAGALAASLTLQTAGAGVLLLIPLIDSERLPEVPFSLPLFLPSVPVPIADVIKTKPAAVPRRGSVLPFQPIFRPADYRAGNQPASVLIEGPDIGLTPAGSPFGTEAVLVLVPLPIPTPPRVALEAAPAAEPTKRVVVSGDVQAAKLIRKIVPAYPHLARAAGISGKVRLTGTIAKDGTVKQLQVIEGNILLVQAAIDAVRQWVYAPTLLHGEAVEVITSIDVNFELAR